MSPSSQLFLPRVTENANLNSNSNINNNNNVSTTREFWTKKRLYWSTVVGSSPFRCWWWAQMRPNDHNRRWPKQFRVMRHKNKLSVQPHGINQSTSFSDLTTFPDKGLTSNGKAKVQRDCFLPQSKEQFKKGRQFTCKQPSINLNTQRSNTGDDSKKAV